MASRAQGFPYSLSAKFRCREPDLSVQGISRIGCRGGMVRQRRATARTWTTASSARSSLSSSRATRERGIRCLSPLEQALRRACLVPLEEWLAHQLERNLLHAVNLDCERSSDIEGRLARLASSAIEFGPTPIVGVVSSTDRPRGRTGGPIAAFVTRPWRASRLMDAIVSAVGDREPPEEPAVRTSDRPQHEPYVPSARVLLVDDNAVNVAIARPMLERLACRVDVAADGSEAVTMVAGAPYDIVLMDCEMPVMDGFEATARIRSGARQPSIPIIAMTANTTVEDRQRCLTAGLNDHIAKPVRAEELAATLNRWLADEGRAAASA